jgi:hypothetical protein
MSEKPKTSSRKTARQLHEEAFSRPRDPRSDAYKEGHLATLRHRLGETGELTCPYQMGTPQADAWFYGAGEARALARAVLNPTNIEKGQTE